MASESNYNIQSAGPTNRDPISQGDVGGSVSQLPLGISLASSLGLSQAEEVQDTLDITVPSIPPPSFSDPLITALSSPSNTISSLNLEMNNICIDMLTKWNDAIKEQIAETKARESSPAYLAEQERKRALTGALSAITANVDLQNSAFTPAITLGLVFASGGGVSEAMIVNAIAKDIPGVNPSGKTVQESPYTQDMRQELGLIGAAFLQGLMTQAQIETVNKGAASSKKEGDSLTAEQFAKGVQGLLKSGDLRALVAAMVISNVGQTESTNKTIDKLTQKLSIFLLASALASLYISEGEGGTGHITGEEFQGLINGTNQTFGPKQELMNSLLAPLRDLLASLSPSDKSAMMASLVQFMNSNPALKTLTNPNQMIRAMAAYRQKQNSEKPA